MKKTLVLILTFFLAITLFLTSCAKKTNNPAATCTITFNGNDVRTADSIRYDYFSGTTPRIQAFVGGVAIITLFPASFSSGTTALAYRYLYWIIQSPAIYTINNTGGILSLTNNNNVLNGSFSGTGDIYSGTGPSPTTVAATFSNVRDLGH